MSHANSAGLHLQDDYLPEDEDVIEDDEPLEDIEILTEVVMALVDKPELVYVEQREMDQDTSKLIVHVDPSDLGKVIGRSGETVSTIRKLFQRIAAGRGRKVYIQIVEPRRVSAPAGRYYHRSYDPRNAA